MVAVFSAIMNQRERVVGNEIDTESETSSVFIGDSLVIKKDITTSPWVDEIASTIEPWLEKEHVVKIDKLLVNRMVEGSWVWERESQTLDNWGTSVASNAFIELHISTTTFITVVRVFIKVLRQLETVIDIETVIENEESIVFITVDLATKKEMWIWQQKKKLSY